MVTKSRISKEIQDSAQPKKDKGEQKHTKHYAKTRATRASLKSGVDKGTPSG